MGKKAQWSRERKSVPAYNRFGQQPLEIRQLHQIVPDCLVTVEVSINKGCPDLGVPVRMEHALGFALYVHRSPLVRQGKECIKVRSPLIGVDLERMVLWD